MKITRWPLYSGHKQQPPESLLFVTPASLPPSPYGLVALYSNTVVIHNKVATGRSLKTNVTVVHFHHAFSTYKVVCLRRAPSLHQLFLFNRKIQPWTLWIQLQPGWNKSLSCHRLSCLLIPRVTVLVLGAVNHLHTVSPVFKRASIISKVLRIFLELMPTGSHILHVTQNRLVM